MRIFVDSGILVEYQKGNNVDFYEELILREEITLFVNQVVISEFLYYFIALSANKSPMSVKEAGQIANSFGERNPLEMLPGFIHLGHNNEIAEKGFEFMKKYNLLPNDALILASCVNNQIKRLATFDSDFNIPCEELGIKIIQKIDDLKSDGLK